MLVTIISAVHSLRMDFIKEYYTSRGYEVENITLEKKICAIVVYSNECF